MKKQVTLNLPVLALIVIFCIFVGGIFGRKTVTTDNFQYKYDSLENVIKANDQIMNETAMERDSARAALKKYVFISDSIQKVRKVEIFRYEQERKADRERWEKLSDDDLVKEAIQLYEKAHPTPLFDDND